ncbi:GNAT family N-acetyltransferase [Nocardia aurantiaca]|uniref:GNAT family N-acetyltransferase n=1 Tax=Nocardia aurantiaca TaxID=2675850 RepID=A0A6I3KTU8_9NOCA|nr:GNAT family N-acetyltransferase [Nocardia aurantiaca]MTE12466.1 GNAT family N-acetyltransferase [Nocardia aurantiaca]
MTSDPVEFRERVAGFLRRDPLRHTALSTAVNNEISGLAIADAPSYFASVHADDVVGVAMRTGRRGVWLGDVPIGAVPTLVTRFAELVPRIDDVHGPENVARPFAANWSVLRGNTYRAEPGSRLYRLGQLRMPAASGSARRATEADIALCRAWLADMARELGEAHLAMSEAAIRARIVAGRYWLWEADGRPVGLAAHQVPVDGWARIGPVYTPPQTRGRGHASALVAEVSRMLRAAGDEVCLYTDIANPTSNKIYRAIGFEAVADEVRYAFE